MIKWAQTILSLVATILAVTGAGVGDSSLAIPMSIVAIIAGFWHEKVV
jgi:hypothetical protein